MPRSSHPGVALFFAGLAIALACAAIVLAALAMAATANARGYNEFKLRSSTLACTWLTDLDRAGAYYHDMNRPDLLATIGCRLLPLGTRLRLVNIGNAFEPPPDYRVRVVILSALDTPEAIMWLDNSRNLVKD